MKKASHFSGPQVRRISEYREDTDSVDVEAIIDLAIMTSWDKDSLSTKEDLCIKVIKADRKNKAGMQRVAYFILGQVYHNRYEKIDDSYLNYAKAKEYYNKEKELSNIQFRDRNEATRNKLSEECLAQLEDCYNKRHPDGEELGVSQENGPSFFDVATKVIGILGAITGKGTTSNAAYSSGVSTTSTGSSSASKTSKQNVTCTLCKGSGRSAAREYAFQAASKPKVWCNICGSKELQHVHNKLCTRCNGKGYITK